MARPRRADRHLPGPQGRLQTAHRSPAPRGLRRTERKKGPNREAVGALLNVRGNGSTGAPSGTCPAHKAASKQPIEACATRAKANGTKEGPQPGSGRGPFTGALLNVSGNGSTGAPFGTCPAHKAASKQPIEALRHEGEAAGERNKKKGPNREAAGALWVRRNADGQGKGWGWVTARSPRPPCGPRGSWAAARCSNPAACCSPGPPPSGSSPA